MEEKRLDALLREAIAAIPRGMNRELALFYLPGCGDESWRVDAVNECSAVMLGEMDGKYFADGATPEGALIALINKLKAHQ